MFGSEGRHLWYLSFRRLNGDGSTVDPDQSIANNPNKETR